MHLLTIRQARVLFLLHDTDRNLYCHLDRALEILAWYVSCQRYIQSKQTFVDRSRFNLGALRLLQIFVTIPISMFLYIMGSIFWVMCPLADEWDYSCPFSLGGNSIWYWSGTWGLTILYGWLAIVAVIL